MVHEQMLVTWPCADGPDQIVDDDCYASMFIHKGKGLEEKYAKDINDLPYPASASDPELNISLRTMLGPVNVDATTWSRMANIVRGVCQASTNGVHRLKVMAKKVDVG